MDEVQSLLLIKTPVDIETVDTSRVANRFEDLIGAAKKTAAAGNTFRRWAEALSGLRLARLSGVMSAK